MGDENDDDDYDEYEEGTTMSTTRVVVAYDTVCGDNCEYFYLSKL